MEYEIGMICRRIQRKRREPISWDELKGTMLERAKLYCKRIGGLDIAADNRTWQEINHYAKVRNCIVHNSGLLKEFEGDTDFINYLNREGIISQDTIERQVTVTEQYCKDVFNTMHTFLEGIRIAVGKL